MLAKNKLEGKSIQNIVENRFLYKNGLKELKLQSKLCCVVS